MWHDIDQTQPATIFVSFFFSYFFLSLILYFVLCYIHIMWHDIDQTRPQYLFLFLFHFSFDLLYGITFFDIRIPGVCKNTVLYRNRIPENTEAWPQATIFVPFHISFIFYILVRISCKKKQPKVSKIPGHAFDEVADLLILVLHL